MSDDDDTVRTPHLQTALDAEQKAQQDIAQQKAAALQQRQKALQARREAARQAAERRTRD